MLCSEEDTGGRARLKNSVDAHVAEHVWGLCRSCARTEHM